jgi:nitrite reductase/ring-hydroxylating ferredoxin subunit
MAAMANVADVPESGSLLVTLRRSETGEREEGILLRTGEEVRCWRNYCQHLTHVRLDKGDGVPTRNGELVCTNHGAMFDVDTGHCTYGPCEGAYLDAVEVAVEDGAVCLVDDAYEFVSVGGMERDPTDLASTSNVEF